MFNFLGLIISLFLVIKGAEYAILYSTKISKGLKIPKYVVGFLLVAFISALPEAFIGIGSALQKTPSFGLGTLLGANVADLTIIFAIVVLLSPRSLKVKSQIIKNGPLYILMIAFPVILGFNGYYSRVEGIALILLGFYFFYFLLSGRKKPSSKDKISFSWKCFLLLVLSLVILLIASHFTVKFGVSFAKEVGLHPVLIGMFFVGLGTTLPELFFSIKAVRKKHDELAIGDIMGMVIADSTLVIGLIATIAPFSFNPNIIYVTGVFMATASVILLYFMKTGRSLNKKEALFLILFYLLFIFAELLANNYF